MSATLFDELYSTANLQRALEVEFEPQDFIWKTFFKETNKSMQEFCVIDKKYESRRLAVFVSPLLEGAVISKKGYFTDVIHPPYIKMKRITDSYNLLTRPMGQNPFANVKSPRAQAMEELGKDTAHLKMRYHRTIEKMCNDAILTGQISVVGHGIDKNYDYQLPASNKLFVGSGITTAWSNASADILGDIEDAGDQIIKNVGRMPNITIMGRNVYKHFRKNEDIRALLDNRRVVIGSLNVDVLPKGVIYVGNIGNMDYYVYTEYYEDETGALVNMFDPDKVVVTSTDLRASVEYGAIRDLEFGGNIPTEMFLKSKMEFDPSAQVLLFQGAPLPVHHQMDGVMVLDPLNAAP